MFKIECMNDKIVQRDETTYLGHAHIAQPLIWHPNCLSGLITWHCWCGKLKVEPRNFSIVQENETAYHGRAQAMQPCRNPSKGCWEVHRTRCRHGQIKSRPTNVSRMWEDGNTYLPCINVILSIWRPGKQIRRVSKLTFESRMLGVLAWWWRPQMSGCACCNQCRGYWHDVTSKSGNDVDVMQSQQTFTLQVSNSIWIGHIYLQQHFIASS